MTLGRSISQDELGRILSAARVRLEEPIRGRAWKKPSPPTAIDHQISSMVDDLSRSDLESRGIKCPYRKARRAASILAFVAYERTKLDQELWRSPANPRGPAEIKKDAVKLAGALEGFIARTSATALAPMHATGPARVDYDEINASLAAAQKALDIVRNASGALHEISSMAARESDRVKNHRTKQNFFDAWCVNFADYLGEPWHEITGAVPTLNQRAFLDFVAAAFNTVGEGLPDGGKQWEHHVRKALERARSRPEFDRHDRFLKHPLAPGQNWLDNDHSEQRKRVWIDKLQRLRAAGDNPAHPFKELATRALEARGRGAPGEVAFAADAIEVFDLVAAAAENENHELNQEAKDAVNSAGAANFLLKLDQVARRMRTLSA